jgi:hypothetical protein
MFLKIVLGLVLARILNPFRKIRTIVRYKTRSLSDGRLSSEHTCGITSGLIDTWRMAKAVKESHQHGHKFISIHQIRIGICWQDGCDCFSLNRILTLDEDFD